MSQHATCHHLTFGLDCVSYDGLIARAGGACEICRCPIEETDAGKLFIDHDHLLGPTAVRGLVCRRCNAVLAKVDARQDPPAHLAEAVRAYLASPWRTDPEPYSPPRALTERRHGRAGWELSVKDFRSQTAEALRRVEAGEVLFLTSYGRRVAAVVPVAEAEEVRRGRTGDTPTPDQDHGDA